MLFSKFFMSAKFLWVPLVRSKSNVHFYKGKNKVQNTELALRHFDNFYSKIYGNQWQSIRLGLLSPKKYTAIVNNFVDFESIEAEFRQLGAHNFRYIYQKILKMIINNLKCDSFLKSRVVSSSSPSLLNSDEERLSSPDLEVLSESESEKIEAFFTEANESELENNAASMSLDLNEFVPVTELKSNENNPDDKDYFKFYEMNYEVEITRIEQNLLELPLQLNLYMFPRNDFSIFPPGKLCQTNLFNYYLVDGASMLPVLLMDIQDGDYIADFCAAPGGKSLLMYLQMKNCHLFLNDISSSRFNRLLNVFNSFIPRNQQKNIVFNNSDACKLQKYDQFDKILVDVPCTNDRHSLYVNENNIFSPKRLNERINVPMKQLNILVEALKSVRIGGTVVYSTCSLSPIQNDGVVHMALKRICETTSLNYSVVELKEALRPLRTVFQFDFRFKYGVQVLPHLSCNFGPMYFCKLIRNE